MREPSDGLQPCFHRRYLKQTGEARVCLLHEDGEALRIQLAHASEMGLEVALTNEFAENELLEHGGVARSERLDGRDAFREMWGHDEIAETESGKEYFAEAARVENLAGVVESLKRGDGAAGVAILAVVVVFKDECAGLPRPREQLEPAREAHGGAERELMAGRDIDEPYAAPGQISYHDAFAVDARGYQLCAKSLEDKSRARITGAFHANAIAGRDEEAGGEVEGLLDARDDGDLLRLTAHAARTAEVVRDGLTQRHVAGGI